MQEITNEVIAEGGVQTGFDEPEGPVFVSWSTTGTEADVESSELFVWRLPEPGQTIQIYELLQSNPINVLSGLLIYDALVFSACGSFSTFPVEHESTIETSFTGDKLGSFLNSDNSTIDSTGIYKMSYTIRAEDSGGGISDFHFRGIANVICSALDTLW